VGEGIVVSDALGFHGFGRTARQGDDRCKTHPPELFGAVGALMPPEQQLSAEFAPASFAWTQTSIASVASTWPAICAATRRIPSTSFSNTPSRRSATTAIAEHLLETESCDLLLVYYEQVDGFSHLVVRIEVCELGDEALRAGI